MKPFIRLLILLAYAFISIINAQEKVPILEWQKTFGGSSDDYALSIQQTDDDGYIVAGFSNSRDGDVDVNYALFEYWIMKLDSKGAISWKKTLGGNNDEKASFIRQTSDGGYVLVGTARSSDGDVKKNYGQMDVWILKLNSRGEAIFSNVFGGPGNEEVTNVYETPDGGYIVGGSTYSPEMTQKTIHGLNDYWIAKLSSTFEVEWQKTYGGPGYDRIVSLNLTDDGGYIVAGYISKGGGDIKEYHGSYDIWVIKLDQEGEMEWQKTLGGTKEDKPASIQQTTDGGYIMLGTTNSQNRDVVDKHGGDDAWVVKLDNKGSVVWKKCLGGDGHDIGASIHQAKDGGYIIAASTFSNNGDITINYGFNTTDAWIVKLSEDAKIVWQRSLGGQDSDHPTEIRQTKDGGFVMCGYTRSVDGEFARNQGSYDYWVVKLSPENYESLGIEEQPEVISKKFSIYPNPAQDYVYVDVDREESIKSVLLTDATGRNMNVSFGGNRIDVSLLHQGVYFVRIQTNNNTYSTKIIKK